MGVHKISKASETTDLDLYLTDPTDSTQHAQRLPHPTMSLFIKPPTNRFPKLAAGREVARARAAAKNLAARKAKKDLPDDVETLRQNMEKAKNEKRENAYVWMHSAWSVWELTCIRTVPSCSIRRWPLVLSVAPKEPTRSCCRA